MSTEERKDPQHPPLPDKEEKRGRPRGNEREDGDIDRAGHRGGLGGNRAGAGRVSKEQPLTSTQTP